MATKRIDLSGGKFILYQEEEPSKYMKPTEDLRLGEKVLVVRIAKDYSSYETYVGTVFNIFRDGVTVKCGTTYRHTYFNFGMFNAVCYSMEEFRV